MSETSTIAGGSGPVSVAVMGCGQWGRNLVRILESLASVDLRWVVDPDPEARAVARRLAPGAGLVEHIEHARGDFQAAVVCTPALDHVAHAAPLVVQGKDVLVEKPIALDVSSAELLATEARSRSSLLMVGHQLLYHPVFESLLGLVSEGAIGRLHTIRSERAGTVDLSREPGVIWSYGPHDVAMILTIAGEEPASVEATGIMAGGDPRSMETASLDLDFSDELRAEIRLSGAAQKRMRRLTVVGDRGSAVFDDSVPGGRLWLFDGDPGSGGEGREVNTELKEPLALECASFLDSVLSREAPRTGPEHAIAVTRVLELAEERISSSSGRGPS